MAHGVGKNSRELYRGVQEVKFLATLDIATMCPDANHYKFADYHGIFSAQRLSQIEHQ